MTSRWQRITHHLHGVIGRGVVQSKSIAPTVLGKRAEAGQARRGPKKSTPQSSRGASRAARHLASLVDGRGVTARGSGQQTQVGDDTAADLPKEAAWRLAIV